VSDEVRRGSAEASAVVWRWREQDENEKARAAKLVRGATLRAVVAAVAGGVFYFVGRHLLAHVAWAVGGITLLLALASPRAYAAVDRAVSAVSHGVGRALTWILLAPVFYLFITPYGLLFRRGARDPMKRRFERSLPSYWKKREEDRANLDRPF
jgi:hypothetical protein